MSVPKFGSFKPKPKPPETPTSGHDRNYESELGEHSEHRRERRHRRERSRDDDKYRRRDHERHSGDRHASSRSRKPSMSARHPKPESTPFADELEESDLFIVDRRGDAKNVEYGSLHRYSVPAYHRTGYGRLIGTSSSTKIDREASSDKTAVLMESHHSGHDRTVKPLSRKAKTSERRFRLIQPSVAEGEDELEEQLDFIDLQPSRKRRRISPAPEHASNLLGLDYRSIEGKAKPSDAPADDDVEDDSDSCVTDTAAQQARRTNAELVRVTKDCPTDLEAWRHLIAYQANVVRPDSEAVGLTSSERRTLADIRLSIYDQALKHVSKGKPGHEDLLLGMMEEGSVIWDSSKRTTKWVEILRQHPGNLELWTECLNFVQTGKDFRYEQCKEVYISCLQALSKARASASAHGCEAIDSGRVYVLLRFTSMVRDAGYDELALATWQAVLEYHAFRPAGLDDSHMALQELELFWDSEVPRIGEEGAKSWAVYAQDQLQRGQTAYHRPSIDRANPFASFAEGEMEMLKCLHLPATTDDETAADDPFRYVMFSDLRPIIEPLLDGLPVMELIDGFCLFMGLPRIQSSHPGSRRWETDQFLHPLSMASTIDGVTLSPIAVEQWMPYTLFDHAFNEFKAYVASDGESSHATVQFVERVFSQLVAARPDNDTLAGYYVAFLQAVVGTGAKMAKKLLKARSSSMRLYNAYSLSEALSGNLEKAEEVWRNALNVSGPFSDDERGDAALLWHSWIMTLLRNVDDEAKVLGMLLAMCDGSSTIAKDVKSTELSASQRLKATQHFGASFDRLVYQHKYELATLYADCHLLFAYFADSHDLLRAISVCEKYDARLSSDRATVASELLHQAQARIIAMHLDRRRPYKPAVIREKLEKSVKLFPNNSVFLGLYRRLRDPIEDRLRTSISDDILRGPSATIVGWTLVVADELRSYNAAAGGSTVSSVRNTFKRALLGPENAVKHSITLWTAWLHFELSLLTQGQSRAKQVFLDGLRFLPWSKAWITEGLKAFSDQDGGKNMSMKELRQMYDVLAERELRLRVSVDEMEDAIAQLDE